MFDTLRTSFIPDLSRLLAQPIELQNKPNQALGCWKISQNLS